MRNAQQVHVHTGVIHLVGEGENRDTVLSNSLLNLSDDDATRMFIATHIRNSLGSEHAMAARWADQQGGVCAACTSVFESHARLLTASRQIANALGLIVREDARITRAALLVANFSLASDGTGGKHIAILKLDPSEGFVQRKQSSDGKTQIVLKRIKNVIPSAREKLQKCAFICNPVDRAIMPPNCDLLVLDRQHRGDTTAADFFLTRFLGAGRSTDDISLTKHFNQSVTHTIAALSTKGLIDDGVRNDIYTQLNAALRGNSVSVESFINNMPVGDEARQIARERLSELADQTFSPDEATALKLTRKAVFKGDHGLHVTVNAEDLNNVIADATRVVDDPEHGVHWRVTLRTKSWQQVPAR